MTAAAAQSQAVKSAITFSFVGLETITGLLLAGLLLFLNVEKTLSRKQQKIREYQMADAAARGEEWVSPEVRAAREEEQYRQENEAAYTQALLTRCAAKGLDFDAELAAHNRASAEKAEKDAAKKRRALEKETQKVSKAQARREKALAGLSPEKRRKAEEKHARRAEKEEDIWEKELAAGEAYRAKIRAELHVGEV